MGSAMSVTSSKCNADNPDIKNLYGDFSTQLLAVKDIEAKFFGKKTMEKFRNELK